MSGPHPQQQQQQRDSHFAAKRKSQQMALHTFRRPLEFARDATAKSRQCRRISHINTFCWRIESAARARHKTHSLKLFSQACRVINFLSTRSPFPAARKKALREFCVRQFWKSAFKTHMCAARRRLLFHSICILSEDGGDCHRSSALPLPGLACCCRSHASLKSL